MKLGNNTDQHDMKRKQNTMKVYIMVADQVKNVLKSHCYTMQHSVFSMLKYPYIQTTISHDYYIFLGTIVNQFII